MSSVVMLIWITTSLLLFARDGHDFVSCQSINSNVDIQSFLNQFCFPGSTHPGCGGTAVIPSDSATPSPPDSTPSSPPVSAPSTPPVSAPPTVSTTCSANERQCPQLGVYCFPSSVDCDAVSTVTCPLPQDYGVETQVLVCGSGSSSGARCGDDRNVPVLTLLMVQCQGSNSIRESHVERFSALNGTGDDGGAGVYLCSATGQWDRKHGSTIENLIVSCRDAGCGRIPHPKSDMPVYRRWSWVRGIYKEDQFICTGTLVSQNALVTAAHCVTESNSPVVDAFLDAYWVELPGLGRYPTVRVQPTAIFIHPKYSRNDNEYRHDMAVIFFKLRHQQRLPTVCITNHQYNQEVGRAQVVFNLQAAPDWTAQNPQPPTWKVIQASWDHGCLTTVIRMCPPQCVRHVLQVQESQFCAAHEGSSLSKGSSGGPYLAEIGQDLEEVWVLMGVLSLTSQVTEINGGEPSQTHSVYGQASDESRWLKDCVFDRKCEDF